MDVTRRRAYRYLLYAAMLDIRPIEWFWFRGLRRMMPLVMGRERRAVQRSGALANWLHNLAEFSALEVERFDEGNFWRQHEALCRRYPSMHLEAYRTVFDGWLSKPADRWPGAEMWA